MGDVLAGFPLVDEDAVVAAMQNPDVLGVLSRHAGLLNTTDGSRGGCLLALARLDRQRTVLAHLEEGLVGLTDELSLRLRRLANTAVVISGEHDKGWVQDVRDRLSEDALRTADDPILPWGPPAEFDPAVNEDRRLAVARWLREGLADTLEDVAAATEAFAAFCDELDTARRDDQLRLLERAKTAGRHTAGDVLAVHSVAFPTAAAQRLCVFHAVAWGVNSGVPSLPAVPAQSWLRWPPGWSVDEAFRAAVGASFTAAREAANGQERPVMWWVSDHTWSSEPRRHVDEFALEGASVGAAAYFAFRSALQGISIDLARLDHGLDVGKPIAVTGGPPVPIAG